MRSALLIFANILLACLNVAADHSLILATVHPCPAAPPSLSVEPVLVTSQFQQVSTCIPKSICIRRRCSTELTFDTFAFLLTTIPCAWNGNTSSTLTVTRTDQPVIISQAYSTITQTLHTTQSAWLRYRLPWRLNDHDISDHTTIVRRAWAPFREIGPFAIPGWQGSGLCESCAEKKDSSREQRVVVLECYTSSKRRKCLRWMEKWISLPQFPMETPAIATISTQTAVLERGTYVWTFPQTAPAAVFTAPPETAASAVPSGSIATSDVTRRVHSFPPRSWNAYVTRTCTGPRIFDFTVYITKTITYTIPWTTLAQQRFVFISCLCKTPSST